MHFFVCLLFAAASAAKTDICGNVLPAVTQMAHGVDFTRLDPYSPNSGLSVLAGLQFTCLQNLTQAGYQVPDQFSASWPIASVSGSVTSATILTGQTTVDVKGAFGVTMGVDVDTFLSSFSASGSFGAAAELMYSVLAQFAVVESDVLGYNPMYNPVFPWDPTSGPQLADVVASYVDKVMVLVCNETQLTPDCAASVNTFISYWGSHFMQSSCAGGLLRGFYNTLKLYVMEAGSAYTEVQESDSFLLFASASGAFSGSVSAVDQKWLAATTVHETVIGGVGVPSSPATFEQWSASVLTNPHVIPCSGAGTQYSSYSTILNSTDLVKHRFDEAVLNYYDLAFLQNELAQGFPRLLKIAQSVDVTGNPQCPKSQDCAAVGACCHPYNVAQFKDIYQNVTTAQAKLVSSLTTAIATVQMLLKQPIVDHTTVLLLLAEYEAAQLQLLSPVTTVLCAWKWQFMSPFGGDCFGPTQTDTAASISYPSSL